MTSRELRLIVLVSLFLFFVEPKNETQKTSFEIKCPVLSLVDQLD